MPLCVITCNGIIGMNVWSSEGSLQQAGHGEGAAAGGGGTADIRGAACMRLACDVLCGCFCRASNLTLRSSQLNECAMSHTYENLDTKDP